MATLLPVHHLRMRAVVLDRFGSPDVLEVREVPIPEVLSGQARVRVHAAAANPFDWHFMRGVPYIARVSGGMGVRAPKRRVLGGDIAGVVDGVGEGATRVRPGDEVYGFVEFGGFAEAVSARVDRLAPKPGNLSFEQAAAVPLAALTALQGLRDVGQIREGQRVLIVGASGGVGTFAVQIAKWAGADVTGVCSIRNAELVRSIGADRVVDYTRQDVTRSGQTYDLILQLAGTTSASAFRRILAPKGRLVLSSGDSPGRVIGPIGRIVRAVLLSPFVSQTLRPFMAKSKSDDLNFITELIEAGTIRPIIDRTYPLSETPDAIRYLETGRARGKVVISVSD